MYFFFVTQGLWVKKVLVLWKSCYVQICFSEIMYLKFGFMWVPLLGLCSFETSRVTPNQFQKMPHLVAFKKIYLITYCYMFIYAYTYIRDSRAGRVWPEPIWIKANGCWQTLPQHQSKYLRDQESVSIETPLSDITS